MTGAAAPPGGAAPKAKPANARTPALPFWRELAQVALLFASTVTLLSLIFQPLAWWPLAFLGLAPWALATCCTQRAWLVHWLSFLAGWIFFLINLSWLMPVTGLGYAALAFYLALYWPLAGWAIRTAQRHGISPLWSLPVTWVACEFLRAWVMTGFPWLFLGHSFAAVLPLIQIADVTGTYGVSFLAALVSGILAEFLLWRWQHPVIRSHPRQLLVGTAASVVLLATTLVYGFARLGQADFRAGPRVAVIQHDFPLVSTPPYNNTNTWVIFAEYVALAAEAVLADQPDLVVFPETVWGATQNVSFLEVENNVVEGLPAGTWLYGRMCHEAISAFARGDYAAVNERIETLQEIERRYSDRQLPRLPNVAAPPVTVVVGATSVETFPEATYPKMKRFNSALVYDPDGTQRAERYDKNHLVPFGEIVPFRHGRFHSVYRWLNSLSPFSDGGRIEYTLTPGEELRVFELETEQGTARFGIPICYEDVMPYIIRDYVWAGGARRVDFLLNISNDAWFLYSAELPQHLAICAMRAVENRVGFARAVNTGISGFIDPNGRQYSLVRDGERLYGRGIIGYRTEPVLLDTRTSIYGRTGDWFAGLCLLLTLALWGTAVGERWIWNLRQRIAAWSARRRSARA